MFFPFRHHNREKFPTKHLMICEDDLDCQIGILSHLRSFLEPQGLVQISCVPGSLQATSILSYARVDLILLDHDMPWGNGADLLQWMGGKLSIPVITFSGIYENNIRMMEMGATYHFGKRDVINGEADNVIRHILGIHPPVPTGPYGMSPV